MRLHRIVAIVVTLLAVPVRSGAGVMPRPDTGQLPAAARERLRADPRAFVPERAFTPLVRQVRSNRLRWLSQEMSDEVVKARGGVAVRGRKQLRILPLTFSDTTAGPVDVKELQTLLFDGPSKTGTLTDYYREVSYGNLILTGRVESSRALKQPASYYAGTCQGLCAQTQVAALVTSRLELDVELDWSQYDNDGIDGEPNSADDDGYVDFVAFVHPDRGGECPDATTMWSHFGALTKLKAPEVTTRTKRPNGAFIKINEFVIAAGRACDGKSTNSIGVLAHELGHALDVPDLYDTDPDNGKSFGAGVWCLMGLGAWGGDQRSPQRPTHPSAWAKTKLGWITPDEITMPRPSASFRAVATSPAAYKVPIKGLRYYLIENRQRLGFDGGLPGTGLIVWRIDDDVIEATIADNRVNANELQKGVGVIEADAQNNLNNAESRCTDPGKPGCGNAGDDGDPFAGSSNTRSFDESSKPRSTRLALCDIGASGSAIEARVLLGERCAPAPTPTPAPAAIAGAASDSSAARQASQPEAQAPVVSLLELTQKPEAWLDRTIRVSGVLRNVGKSYFKDLQLVLMDASQRTIAVDAAHVALEAAPTPSGAQPRTLATFLAKPVDVLATVRSIEERGEKKVVLELRTVTAAAPRQ